MPTRIHSVRCYATCQRANALYHREEAVLARRAEVIVQAKLAEDGLRVGLQNLVRRPAVEDELEHGDEAAHDERVAVRTDAERAGSVRVRFHHQPHQRLAAVDAVALGLLRIGQAGELLAEIDQLAVALLPIAEQFEVRDELFESHNEFTIYDFGFTRPKNVSRLRRVAGA